VRLGLAEEGGDWRDGAARRPPRPDRPADAGDRGSTFGGFSPSRRHGFGLERPLSFRMRRGRAPRTLRAIA